MNKSDLELDCMELQKHRTQKDRFLKEAFLRKPYAGTKAETKDDTQQKLHKYDYLK